MGVTLLGGVPALWLTLALGGPIASRIAFGTLVAAMSVLAVSAAAVAISKGGSRHSVRDLLWLTLVAALGCSITIYTDVLIRAGFLFALISIVSIWWTIPVPREGRIRYLLRLAGHFVLITVLVVVVVGGASTALSMMLHRRSR